MWVWERKARTLRPVMLSTISVKVTRPQIYYGQLTNSYVFVGTGQKEFDYPAENQNIYANYHGRGGVPMGSGPASAGPPTIVTGCPSTGLDSSGTRNPGHSRTTAPPRAFTSGA